MKRNRLKANARDRALIGRYVQVARENGCCCGGEKSLYSKWNSADAEERQEIRHHLRRIIAQHKCPNHGPFDSCFHCFNTASEHLDTVIVLGPSREADL